MHHARSHATALRLDPSKQNSTVPQSALSGHNDPPAAAAGRAAGGAVQLPELVQQLGLGSPQAADAGSATGSTNGAAVAGDGVAVQASLDPSERMRHGLGALLSACEPTAVS